MNRRQLHATLATAGLAALAFTPLARAQSPVAGRDFTKIEPPQPTTAGAGKVEVLEFFSYACPHCFAFEPELAAWAKTLPADVVFKRVPVPFLFNAENFQRTYYALEAMGLAESMSIKVFNAVHIDKQRLDKVEDIAALVAKNGGDAAKFTAAFKSFSVATAVSKAKKMNGDYRIDGVPSLTVQGRWLTSPSLVGGSTKSLQVCNGLIEMGPVRQGLSGAAGRVSRPSSAEPRRFDRPCRPDRGAWLVRLHAVSMVPAVRIERTTFRLQGGCSTS